MPQYFFTASDSLDADDLGIDLIDGAAATRFAVQYAGRLISDEPDLVSKSRDFCVTVTDEAQRRLSVVRISME